VEDAGGVLGRDYVAVRRLYLEQPSANFLHYHDFAGDVRSGLVQLLPPSPTDQSFAALAPPEPPEGADA